MKILHIINNLESEGAQKLLIDLCVKMKEIYAQSIDLLVLSERNNKFQEEIYKYNIKVNFLSNNSKFDLRFIFKIRKFIKQNNYTHVHSHLFPSNYYVLFATLGIQELKLITTEHSTSNKRRKYLFFKILERNIYNGYNKIIGISDEASENLITHTKRYKLKEKIITIYNGIDIEKYHKAIECQKELLYTGYQKDHKLLIMVARFSVQKDHYTLVKTLKKLDKNVHLILLGEGELKENMITFTQENMLTNRVHFLGYKKNVSEIIKACDIAILSSNWEGFGLAAIESMACGIPTIVSNIEGVGKIVEKGAETFEKGNHVDLSNKIRKLFDNKEYYNELSNKGKLVANKYDIGIMVCKYLKLYAEI